MSDDDQPTPTPRYCRVLDAAAKLARQMGHPHVGVEHLFLAIIRDRATVPTQALARLIDLDQVETGLREVMASPSYAGQPPTDAVWLPLSELHETLAALPGFVPPGTRYGFNIAGDRAWIVVDRPADAAEAVASARAMIDREHRGAADPQEPGIAF
jgi:hypothetical protein